MTGRFIITAITAIYAVTATAQTDSLRMTLDDCIAYALDHNLDVRSRLLDAENARIQVASAKDAFLPTVTGQASQTFSFGRSVGENNVKVSSNANAFSWGVNASLPLFDGLKNVRSLRTARLNLTAMLTEVDAARDDVTLRVIAAYLQTLLCDELTKVQRARRDMSATEVQRQRSLVEEGKAPELDLLQAESTLAQDEADLVSAEGDSGTALLDLMQLLMLPQDTPLQVVPLEGETVLIPDAEEVYRNAVMRDASVMARRNSLSVADSRVSLAKTGWLPSLSLSASVGSSFTKFSNFDSQGFAAQMRDNMQEMVGLTLSVPLFDAFATKRSVAGAKVDRLMAELELERADSDLHKAITKAWYLAETARKKAEAGAVAESAAASALEAMTVKYNYGRATATEYEQARTDYVRAASQTIQARYEYLTRAKILEFYNRPR